MRNRQHLPIGVGRALGSVWVGALLVSAAPAAPGRFDVREHGAVGNGQTLESAAINQAIQQCAASGGGVVWFPPGKYLSGTLHLKSGVTLLFEAGATLVGSTNLTDYQHFSPPADTPEGRFRSRWHRALILGDGVEKVCIAGAGLIDGNKVFDPQGEERMRGPHTVLLGNSRQITIRDVSVIDSANYAVLLENCQQVEVRNVRITGGWDGVHFRGWPGRPCRDVSIVGCQFFTGDDAIAGRYWENVLISDCIVNSSCNGLRLIGPATHLIVRDCLFYGPGAHPHRTSNRYNMLAALNLQPGGWDRTEGNLDDVLLSDLTIHNVTTPCHFSLKPGNTAGCIVVSRVSATGVYRAAASVESWAEAPFTNVVFRDVSIEFEGGGTREQARQVVKTPGVDARPLPAWGFYVRNARQLTFENVRLGCLKEDFRPVLMADGVELLRLDAFKFPRPAEVTEALALTDVAQVGLRDTEVRVLEPQCLEVKPLAEGGANRFVTGKPYTVTVTAQSGDREGLGQIELVAAGQRTARWVWFAPNERKEVIFKRLTAPGPGTYELKAGAAVGAFRVEP